MNNMVKTGKRLKMAASRDAKFLKEVAKLAKSFMGEEGIWKLFHNSRMKLLRLLPAAPSGVRKSPHRMTPAGGGTVERLAFPHRDNRNPWHPQHNDLHHGGAVCGCMGRGSPREALKEIRL